jgi:translation initiation factor 4A
MTEPLAAKYTAILNPSAATTLETWEDDEIDIDINILRGIYAYGYDKPSPIQQKAILPMVSGRDIVAQAQSGTGKTGAFSIGTLALTDPTMKQTQAIIMAPTRELTLQNYNVISALGQYYDITIQCLIGGTPIIDDIRKYKENTPHIVVGSSGRIYDLINRGILSTKYIKVFVLDEADEMLSHGFKEQVYQIFKYFNEEVQVALFSATMPDSFKDITTRFMRDPIQLYVDAEMLTLEGIEQYYVEVNDDNEKVMTIKDLFDTISVSQCIIYCNSVSRVRTLTDLLGSDRFPVISIHGDMSQEERKKAFNEFKQGAFRVLISSDITARGIDIQQVSVVINFDVSKNVHTYLHRIGRSGRWGRKGLAINLISHHDQPLIKAIEEHYRITIQLLPATFGEHIRK